MRIALKTFGCKVNQAESDMFAAAAREGGMTCVNRDKNADVYVVNSCSVTREAERKAGRYIRRILRRSPGAVVVLAGCYARRLAENGERPFGERVVSLVSLHKVSEMLEYIGKIGGSSLSPSPIPCPSRSRVWLKVEDGCEHYCTYCIVPLLRGTVRSTPREEVVRVAKELEDRGYREIVLCGINLAWYGRDLRSGGLADLLETLVHRTRYARFRLSSLEPFAVDRTFFSRCLALDERICPHFHLPLQSGSDHILGKMGRDYNTLDFFSLVEEIRNHHPLAAITTDVMVGFPGESEEHFRQTLACMRKGGFSRTHLFRFSPRPGTPAALWDRKEGVPEKEKKKRERLLRTIAEESEKRYREKFFGSTVPVVVERRSEKEGFGHSDTYLPVHFTCPPHVTEGELIRVAVMGEAGGVLSGKVVDDKK